MVKEQAQQLLKDLMESNDISQPAASKPAVVVFMVDQLTLQLNVGPVHIAAHTAE